MLQQPRPDQQSAPFEGNASALEAEPLSKNMDTGSTTRTRSLVDWKFFKSCRIRARFMSGTTSPQTSNWMGLVDVPYQAICYGLPGEEVGESETVPPFDPISISAEDFFCTLTNHRSVTGKIFKENQSKWLRHLVAVELPRRPAMDEGKTHRFAYYLLVKVEPPRNLSAGKGNADPNKVKLAYDFLLQNMDDTSISLWFVNSSKDFIDAPFGSRQGRHGNVPKWMFCDCATSEVVKEKISFEEEIDPSKVPENLRQDHFGLWRAILPPCTTKKGKSGGGKRKASAEPGTSFNPLSSSTLQNGKNTGKKSKLVTSGPDQNEKQTQMQAGKQQGTSMPAVVPHSSCPSHPLPAQVEATQGEESGEASITYHPDQWTSNGECVLPSACSSASVAAAPVAAAPVAAAPSECRTLGPTLAQFKNMAPVGSTTSIETTVREEFPPFPVDSEESFIIIPVKVIEGKVAKKAVVTVQWTI